MRRLRTEAARSKQMIAAKRRSEILAATIYLSAALFMLLYLRLYFYWIRDSWAENLHEIVPLLGAAMLLVSSIRLFVARRFADLLALAGAILAWPYFRLAAFPPRYAPSPWLTFNLPGESSEVRSAFLISTFVILATSSMVAATAYSVLRLTPRTWSSGDLPLCDRAWPGFVVTFLFMVAWYLSAVTPYQIPILDIHQNLPWCTSRSTACSFMKPVWPFTVTGNSISRRTSAVSSNTAFGEHWLQEFLQKIVSGSLMIWQTHHRD